MSGFASANGWGNFPQGNWSPIVFSKQLHMFLRTASVANEITNTDYAGEIKGQGSEIRVLVEPSMTIQDIERGTDLVRQDIDDAIITMNIDKAKGFRFDIDDIEKAMSIVDYQNKIMNGAMYSLRNAFDQDILDYMGDNGTAVAALGLNGTPVTVGYGGGNTYTPLDLMGKAAQLLDENNVPEEGRFAVITPAFQFQLGREDGKLVEVDVTGDAESIIRQRKLATSKMIHGFTVWKTNNLPVSSSSNVRLLFGHIDSTATATALVDTKVTTNPFGFQDIYMGKLVYGRKLFRAESLFVAHVTLGDA